MKTKYLFSLFIVIILIGIVVELTNKVNKKTLEQLEKERKHTLVVQSQFDSVVVIAKESLNIAKQYKTQRDSLQTLLNKR